MKIHKCYFCNYSTHLKHNLRTHVMKQNKCSYLIKSISINSIEDYYNLRDLHIKDPNNHIWGIDYTNQPAPEYYDSDEECSSDLVDKNTKYVYSVIESKISKSITCQYCNKEYSRNDSLKRHYITCKKKKEYEYEEEKKRMDEIEETEEKELIEQIKFLKKLMNEQNNKINKQEEKIKYLEENNNKCVTEISNSNNTTNNTQNIVKQINNNQKITNNNQVKNEITINTFGLENKKIFDDEKYMLKWLNAPFTAIPNMIEKLHFNPDKRPENTNIRINNISNGKAQVFKYGQWKTIMKHDLIHELIGECAFHLIEFYDDYVKKGLIDKSNVFEKFKRQYNKDDNYFIKTQTEQIDCKLVDLMKKHKTYLNSLD